MRKYPDFLRQVFNVVLAEHQSEIGSRLIQDLRKMVWIAENKYKFNSFEVEDPREALKKYFEKDFGEVLRLLKNHKGVIEELMKKVDEYYGKECSGALKRTYEKVVSEND